MKKLWLFLISGVLFFGLVGVVSAATLKIGVVDLHRVLQNDPQVKVEQNKIKRQFGPQEKKLIAMRKNLLGEVSVLRKAKVINKHKKTILTRNIVANQRKLRSMEVKFHQAFVTAQNKALAKVLGNVKFAIKKVAKREQLSIVLDQTSVIYSGSAVDITNQVIKVLN